MITQKQRNILTQYISTDNIRKLESTGFKNISSFINLIFQTSDKRYRCCKILIVNECSFTEIEKKEIEENVNKYRERYNGSTDEYYSLQKAYIIPQCNLKFYALKQTWFKGMSNAPTHHTIIIDKYGEYYPGDYNVLINLNIYSVHAFMDYLKRNTFIK